MKKHLHIIHPSIYLIFASICYLALNFSFAANKSLTIIDTPTTNNTTTITKNYSDITSISYQLILSHIKIGNSNWWLDYLNLDTENNILILIGTAEDLVKTDILQSLQITRTPEKLLDSHLQKTQKTISEAKFSIMILEQEIDNQTQIMNACIEEKKLSDITYFKSIDYYNQKTLNTSLQTSAYNNECIAKAKLTINAKWILLNRLFFYNNLLQKKHKFLSDKRTVILKNISVIDQDLLKELYNINTTLEQYNF